MPDQSQLRSRLSELIAKHEVPGAAIGILQDGQVTEAAAGVINKSTRVEATTDTVWQIGSMTKPWTTTVVMQLVDEGKVDLDAPVRTYLPTFKVADADVSASVTLRDLFSHRSGIDGDHFQDFGRGDECLEKYVDACETLHQTHPLRETMSYCNTGFSIAGRVTEVLTEKVWDAAMRERLFEPLGLTHTSTLPEEAILRRTAVGHVALEVGAPFDVTPVWMLPRVCGPMGLINATTRDVLAFAKMHLDGGKAADGTQVLSDQSVRAMQEQQVEIPNPYTLGSHWGVGWILFDWNGRRLYGHDGNTIGQSAFLRVAPDANLAITMLTNGGRTHDLYEELFAELFRELASIEMPEPLTLPAEPVSLDLRPYAGTYERLGVRMDLEVEDGVLTGKTTVSGPLAERVPSTQPKLTFTPCSETAFLVSAEGSKAAPASAVFYDFVDGSPRYLHSGARTNPRVG